MSDNKLIALINSLSGVEKREFHHFLRSPFFNRRPEIIQLWDHILENGVDEDSIFQKKDLFEMLYPDEEYDDVKLRYAFTFLREKIEWFLAYRQFYKDEATEELTLAEAYREKGLGKHFNQTWRRAQKKTDDLPLGQHKRFCTYKLEFEKYLFAEKQKRTRESTLQNVHDSFDKYLIVGKLRLACYMAAQQAVVNIDYDFSFLEILANWLESSPFIEEPVIGLYYHCYRALAKNDEVHFNVFRQKLEVYGGQFDPVEIKDILLLAINFCIRQVNAGKRQFITDAFDLYKLGLKNDLLTEAGVMSRFTYKNIVALGLGLEAFEWVAQFIEDWRGKLDVRYQESSYHFNLAKLYFAQKNYPKAMPLLAQVDDTDFLLMLDAKVLLLKMYYESGEWDALDSLLASFKTYLRRKKQIGYHEEHYKSLISYTNKLLSSNSLSKNELSKLKSEILENEKVLEKAWLLSQLGG